MSSTSLNDTLMSLGLDWHYSDTGQPNLLYLIAAIDGVSCRQDKTVFNINLSPSRPQLELVDRESVVRAIPLPSLLSCEPAVTDSHTLQLVHLSEGKRERSKHKGRYPQATTHMLRLTFPSLDDAHDVAAILRACSYLASSATPLPPTSPLLNATIHGQLCLHKAWIEKQSSTSHLSWAKRYLLLFPNRLILYRSATAAYPVNVLPLTVDDIDSHAVVKREKGKLELNLRQMWGLDGREMLVWKGVVVGGSGDELSKWMAAIATEQTASFRTPVSALLSAQLVSGLQAGRGSDERWLSSVSSTSRRSSLTEMPLPPPLPPLPPPAVMAAALSSITATSSSSSSSTSPKADNRTGSFSTQFAGNPMLDGCSPAAYSPNASPPFNAAVFLSTLSSQVPLLHIAPSTSTSRDSSSAPPLSLAALLSSPRSYFTYLQHLSSLPLLFPSELPILSGFHRTTPQPLFKKRGKLMLSIDHALTAYHSVVEACVTLLHDSRLVMIDEFEQSGSGQIGFAYFGMDEQVFDVGRLSVVSCGQLMAASSTASSSGSGLEFTRSDYLCAIDSNSPAKELMQSSPDVSALYEAGEVAEAKRLSTAAQRVMLHNCALAQHLKSRIGQSSRHMLAHNELVPWSSVLSSVSTSPLLPNAAVLQSFLPCVYVTNPPLATLQQLLALHSHTSVSPKSAATVAATSFSAQQSSLHAPFSSAPVSPQGSPDSSPLSSQPSSPKATPGTHYRKATGLRDLWQHARRGSESTKEREKAVDERRDRTSSHSHNNSTHKVNTISAGRQTPPTSITPPHHSHPPSHSSSTLPASVSSLAGLVCEDGSVARPLLNPLHMLLLLRCLCSARLAAIQRLEAACTEWWRKRREEKGQVAEEEAEDLMAAAPTHGNNRGGDRMDSVAALIRKTEDERARVMRCIAALPDPDELDRQREMQEREDRDTVSRNAHMRKRQEERVERLQKDSLIAVPPPLPTAPDSHSRQSSESAHSHCSDSSTGDVVPPPVTATILSTVKLGNASVSGVEDSAVTHSPDSDSDEPSESRVAVLPPPLPVVVAPTSATLLKVVNESVGSVDGVDDVVIASRGSDVVTGRGSIVKSRMAMFERLAT